MTDAKADANRRNAQNSTGPRTSEGKAVARFNALWHGGCAASLLLPGEDPRAFSRLQKTFLRRFKPEGPEEQFLVDRMLLAAWRLHRLAALEARVVKSEAASIGSDTVLFDLATFIILGRTPSRDKLPPPDPDAPPQDLVASAYIRDSRNARALVKLSRWQIALERSYYRAFQELERLRATPK